MTKRVQKQYTDEDIRQAAIEFALKGKFSAVERSLNIPRQTLQSWAKNSDVWEAMLSKTRHEKDQAPTTNLTKLNGNTMGADSLVEQGSKYTDEQRREAAVLYASKGVMSAVSRDTGIPESTLCEWKNKSSWWVTVLEEARSEISDRILPQYLEIVEKANERQVDSLKNGDEKLVWDPVKKKHVVKLVKPTGKDASFMGGLAQDKARTLLGLPNFNTSNKSTEDAIKDLAKIFKDLSDEHKAEQLKEKQVSAIPGEYKKIEKDQEK